MSVNIDMLVKTLKAQMGCANNLSNCELLGEKTREASRHEAATLFAVLSMIESDAHLKEIHNIYYPEAGDEDMTA